MLYLKRSFCVTIVAIFLVVLTTLEARAQQKGFDLHGIYLEGCSCKLVCTCDLKGAMVPGCQVMGAMIIASGTYGDSDISGVRIAFAIGDKWVRIYVHSKDPAKSEVAGQMARSFYSSYGRVETIPKAEINLSGSNGNYVLKVDGGKVMNLRTQPVLGADRKTAVTYTNYPDPLFQTIMQGKVISGSYSDGEHHFKLEGTNSFFNQDWAVSGKM